MHSLDETFTAAQRLSYLAKVPHDEQRINSAQAVIKEILNGWEGSGYTAKQARDMMTTAAYRAGVYN